MDKDHSGFISLTEYKLFFKCLGLTPEDAAVSFAIIDKNGDGKLSIKEFVKLGREFFLTEDEKRISRMFWGPLVNHWHKFKFVHVFIPRILIFHNELERFFREFLKNIEIRLDVKLYRGGLDNNKSLTIFELTNSIPYAFAIGISKLCYLCKALPRMLSICFWYLSIYHELYYENHTTKVQ